MSEAPRYIFVNEYDWGFGGAYFTDRSEAKATAMKRDFEDNNEYIKTHKYELVPS